MLGLGLGLKGRDFLKNLRSSFQKKINKDVSTIASTYVRFSFALPLALVLFFIYFREVSIVHEILNQPGFLINVTLASIFQVIFTFVLLYLFKFSNFVVGTSLSKTEVVQVAIFEYLILNEKLSKLGLGLRGVPETIREAAIAYGASKWYLLRKVDLPLATPSILAGVNQTTKWVEKLN